MCRIFHENLSLIGQIVFSKSCQPGRKTMFQEKRDLLLFIKILCKSSDSKFLFLNLLLTFIQQCLLHIFHLQFSHNSYPLPIGHS